MKDTPCRRETYHGAVRIVEERDAALPLELDRLRAPFKGPPVAFGMHIRACQPPLR